MVKNKNAVKGLLVLGGVGTAAVSVYTISKTVSYTHLTLPTICSV